MLVNTPGALTLESGTGMCRGHDPFFQASRRSLNLPSCVPHVPPPHHLNFKKILHFQTYFGQNFSSQDANFPNVRSQDPYSFSFLFFFFFTRKTYSLRPTFRKFFFFLLFFFGWCCHGVTTQVFYSETLRSSTICSKCKYGFDMP